MSIELARNSWSTMKTRTSSVTNKVLDTFQSDTDASTVFGAAPTLDEMISANQATNGKKILFRGAYFWYHFRRLYFFIAPVAVILGLVLALTLWNTVEGHLMIGSLISLFSGISVVASYVMIIPWRKHPSTIVYNRALVNIFFSFNCICDTINRHLYPDASCEGFAVVTQFFLLAGELWLTCVALDLVFSLTNPFTSYRGNMRFYHFVVWGSSSFLAFILMVDQTCQDRFEGGVCWVRINSFIDPCIWGFYLFWILCMYVYQFGAIIFAYLRLKKGLPITFEIRSKCAAATFQLLFAYGIYLFFMFVSFCVVASIGAQPPGTPGGNFALVFLYGVSIRGFVDAWVWFRQHHFARPSEGQEKMVVLASIGQASGMANLVEEARKPETHSVVIEEDDDDDIEYGRDRSSSASGMRKRSSSTASEGAMSRRQSLVSMAQQITNAVSDGLKDVAEATIKADMDETDLSPQVNLALRQQIVKYVTMGIMQAASLQIASDLVEDEEPPTVFDRAKKGVKIVADVCRKKDPILDNMMVTEFLLDNEHPFKAFAPDVFHKLRSLEGIDDQQYLQALQTTEKEQLSEGASGAFMFFCGGGDLIVKTIKKGEADVLHRSIPQLLDYLEENPKSLLVRFLGSYSLGVYAQTFYFVVMRNLFEPGTDINERYDIKGSWVNRSASPAVPNKKVVCRHCNEMFMPVNKEKCSQIVGHHEPNVVLKDNDLRTKISLRSKDAFPVLEIIKRDSDLLAELGVMDYSLIVGVKTCKFSISLDGENHGEDEGSDDDAQNQEDNHSNHMQLTQGSSPQKGQKVKHYATFGAKSVTGAAIYYMGIVDFLQNWTLRKKTERAMKIYLLGQEAEGTSVMHPDPYKERFQNKMDEIFDLELLESRRRKKMKNKKNGTQAANEKKRISGRAFAPAGTTLNKNKSKSTTSVSSVGFVVDAPEEESELPPAAVDIIQQTRPFGANGTPGASPTVKNSVRFSNQVDDATNPLLKQEFSDVQI